MKDQLYLPILITSLIHFSLKGWENVLFELGSEGVNYRNFALQEDRLIISRKTFSVG